MKFKFDANQDFQLHAIESVAGIFKGQPRWEVELTFEGGFASVPNRLDLDDAQLLANLQAVQQERGLLVSEALHCIEETIQTVNGEECARFYNFSVEMETGTGKTYVYLRTALELFRRYGLRKYIIVVPSIAVREGVLKAFAVTSEHLRTLYDNTPYRSYAYDSGNLSQVRQFALSDSVEFMVMTIDSFNKASNVIRQSTDRLQGETPIHLVQSVRPVLILDEPQNMESELRIKALAALHPLMALRYSATHRQSYNLVYRLTPFDAYRQGLVKRIEVAGVTQEDDENAAFLRLEDLSSDKRTFTAKITVHKLMANGTVREKTVTVRLEDNLRDKANREEYAAFTVDEINVGEGFVRFSNGAELRKGETRGADKAAIFEAQIRHTLEAHFLKQRTLQPHDIKVLSLFFIDRVDNYAKTEGIIRVLFEKCFRELAGKYPEWKGVDLAKARAAYFAQRKLKGGEIEYEDTSGETQKDTEAYDLIMKDKERLLSFEEPACFIFSHSALREGWDNPNVFQICTLNQTGSEMKKRQEIGRGVRLAVSQSGDRVHDEQINVLTVVANESYERYVERLQTEIREEYGEGGVPPKPPNARKRLVSRLRKAYILKPEFAALWERIKHKTRYSVSVDTAKLIADAVAALDAAAIAKPRITITKARVTVGSEDAFSALQMSAAKTVVDLAGRYPLPNLMDIMEYLMLHTTPPVRLARSTLVEIVRRTTKRAAAVENPQDFAAVVVRILKEKVAQQLIDGIRYEKINKWYEMTQFDAEIEGWEDYFAPAQRSIYDHVEYESDIEKTFIAGLDARDDVKLYVKLPRWFVVDTPIGTYNPDWAVVMEERDEHGRPTGKSLLYLVRETKPANWQTSLRTEEKQKITCGERHFRDALNVDYRVVTTVSELP